MLSGRCSIRGRMFTLILFSAALLLLLCSVACAADAVNFTIETTPTALSKPGKVEVLVRVVNTGSSDMTEPVSLYDPAGQLVTSFGDGGQAVLSANSTFTAQTSWNVTQEELTKQSIAYTLRYSEIQTDGSEAIKTLTATTPIAYSGTQNALSVKRTVTPEVARKNGTVTVTYELNNVGTEEITNLRIRENTSISKTAQSVAKLAPGAKETIVFNAVMGSRNITSAPTITYQVGNSRGEVALSDWVVPLAVPGLSLNNILSADSTSVETGDSVTLILTIPNKGNITYNNISATDATYGQLFSGLSLGPGETLVAEKKLKLKDTATLKLSVTLPDNTGTTNTVESNALKISVYDPSQVMHMTVAAYPEATAVNAFPADMRFTITVTNNSNTEAKNVDILHGSTKVFTIKSLAPTESYTITRDFTLSQAGRYQFTASTVDTLNNRVSFESSEVYIGQAAVTAAPTQAPVITIAPLVTVTAVPLAVLEPTMTQASQIARTAVYVLGALLAVVLVLFVVASVMRIKRAGEHRKAIDSLDVVTMRDYKNEEEETLSFAEDDPETDSPDTAENTQDAYAPAQTEEDSAAAESASREETYNRAGKVIGAQDLAEDFDAQDNWDSGYRLSRTQGEKAVESAEETEEKHTRRRRRRSQADEDE